MQCFKCGYDLAAHELGDACPECGRIVDGKRHSMLALWVGAALFVPPLLCCLVAIGVGSIALSGSALSGSAPSGSAPSGSAPPVEVDPPSVGFLVLSWVGLTAALLLPVSILVWRRPIRWTALWSAVLATILGIVGIAGTCAGFSWLTRGMD